MSDELIPDTYRLRDGSVVGYKWWQKHQCPGGDCIHYDCIIRYETTFTDRKRYFI